MVLLAIVITPWTALAQAPPSVDAEKRDADAAMYYAKSNGRNQACHYDQLVQGGLLQAVPANDTAEFF